MQHTRGSNSCRSHSLEMDQDTELKPKGFNSTTEKLAYQVYPDTIHHIQYWNQSRFSSTGTEM